jgi:hypothetical protein
MPCDLTARPSQYDPLPNDPTPAEIAAGCRQIRGRWTEHETRRRSAWAHSDSWTAPVVTVDDETDFR